MNENENVTTETNEKKGMSKLGKGLLIGGIAAVAGIVGLVIHSKRKQSRLALESDECNEIVNTEYEIVDAE